MSVFGLDLCSYIFIHPYRFNLHFLHPLFLILRDFTNSQKTKQKKAGCYLTSMAEAIKPSKTRKKPATSRQKDPRARIHTGQVTPPPWDATIFHLHFYSEKQEGEHAKHNFNLRLMHKRDIIQLIISSAKGTKLKTGNHHKLKILKYGQTRWKSLIWKRWLEKGHPGSLFITYNFECSMESTNK